MSPWFNTFIMSVFLIILNSLILRLDWRVWLMVGIIFLMYGIILLVDGIVFLMDGSIFLMDGIIFQMDGSIIFILCCHSHWKMTSIDLSRPQMTSDQIFFIRGCLRLISGFRKYTMCKKSNILIFKSIFENTREKYIIELIAPLELYKTYIFISSCFLNFLIPMNPWGHFHTTKRYICACDSLSYIC